MLGSTDVQVARLFQRRIALDTLFGGAIGSGVGAGLVVVAASASRLRRARLGTARRRGAAAASTGSLLAAAAARVRAARDARRARSRCSRALRQIAVIVRLVRRCWRSPGRSASRCSCCSLPQAARRAHDRRDRRADRRAGADRPRPRAAARGARPSGCWSPASRPACAPIELARAISTSPRAVRLLHRSRRARRSIRARTPRRPPQWVRAHSYRSVRLVTRTGTCRARGWNWPHALGANVEVRRRRRAGASRGFAMLVSEYNKYLLRRVALLDRDRRMIAWLRNWSFTIVFYGDVGADRAAAPIVGAVRRTRGDRACARSGRDFHRWCARCDPRHPTSRIEGDAADRAGALRRASTRRCSRRSSCTRMLDGPAIVMKRELARHPGLGLGGAALRRDRRRPRGVGDGAAQHDARGDRRRMAEGRSMLIFPEGTRVPPGEHPPLQLGLRRALPGAEAAGGADRARQRAGLAETRAEACRDGDDPLRRADPAGPAARRDRARVHAAINALDVEAQG